MNNILRAVGITFQPSKFKQICSPQQRWKKHLSIVKGNPNQISIVLQRDDNQKIAFDRPYFLFGVEKSCAIYELRQKIREKLKLKSSQNFILSCNKVILSNDQKIKNLQRFTEADGFIYFYVSSMETFG